ncbi:MAG: YARHG domain-containing protein [Ruminococcus sp.]|nr:YARHG domain-containing protein [Ruminococcus sp.]
MKCNRCGTENNHSDMFCKNCGNNLSQQKNNYQNQMNYSDNFEYKNTNKKSYKIPIIIAVTAVVVIAIGAGVFFLLSSGILGGSSGQVEETTVPSTQQTEITTEAPTTIPETKPTTVSMAVIPDVVGMKSVDAYNALNSAGVRYSVTLTYSDTVASDYVISQSPTSGNTISKNDRVIIYLSKGPENQIATYYPENYANSDEYVLIGSDMRYIDKSEVYCLSKDNMEIALNEIYARHGRKFASQELSNYFNSKSWYRGTVEPSDFNENVFNKYELANINTILEVMKECGYR